MMKSFLIISSCLASGFIHAQFNTLTFVSAKDEQAQNVFTKSADTEKSPKMQKEKSSKKWRLFGGTSKSELKNEIDSLKILIKDLKFLAMNKTQDSVFIPNTQSVESPKMIRKYQFIEEPKMINKIHMPLADNLMVTSSFGFRTHPVFGGRKMHNGVDFKANYQNVYAVLDGTISDVGYDKNGGGYYIKIQHSKRFETSYLHLSQIYYKTGEPVKAGFIIGKSGNSGNSTAPHLHFAVKEHEKFINPITFLNDLIKINNLIAIQNEH